MKITLTKLNIATYLRLDSQANWSSEGALALAEYLDNLDVEGTETEFNTETIRNNYEEYSSATQAVKEYLLDGVTRTEEESLEWLTLRTLVIQLKVGIIIQRIAKASETSSKRYSLWNRQKA